VRAVSYNDGGTRHEDRYLLHGATDGGRPITVVIKYPVTVRRAWGSKNWFSEDELKLIVDAASAAGMKLSTYIRKAAVEAAGGPQPTPDAAGLAKLHADLLAALGRVKDMEKSVKEHGLAARKRRRNPVSDTRR
jgi:hypothetical protein